MGELDHASGADIGSTIRVISAIRDEAVKAERCCGVKQRELHGSLSAREVDAEWRLIRGVFCDEGSEKHGGVAAHSFDLVIERRVPIPKYNLHSVVRDSNRIASVLREASALRVIL